MRKVLATAVLGLVVAAAGVLPSAAAPPPGASSCPDFPADSFWHADVRSLPVHPRSDAWLANMGGAARRLHPDFGDSGGPQPYGIPYKVVDAGHQKVTVDFQYADESDPGPYPFGPDVPIEGGSDRHALMIDRDACILSELFAADWNGGAPTAGSGAVFDLRSNALRPAGWTSADAAGLPIFPGLLRRDEVLAGRIDHPIRMTAQRTDRTFVWPARHQAGAARDANLPPMGAWFRMRSDHPIDGLHPHTKVIVEAFKTHGLILADNGSNWYVTGAADEGWEPRVLNELKALSAGSFEAIDQSSLMIDANSGAVRRSSGSPPAPPPVPAPTTTTTSPPTPPAPPTAAPATTMAPTATTKAATPRVATSTTTTTPTTTTNSTSTTETMPTPTPLPTVGMPDPGVAAPATASAPIVGENGRERVPRSAPSGGRMIGFIVFGLIVGAVARALVPGRQDLSLGMTLLLGVVGSVVGGIVANILGTGDIFELNVLGALVAFATSVALVVIGERSGILRRRSSR